MTQDLEFGTIRSQLDTLHVAIANKVEREWPPKWSQPQVSSVVVRGHIKVAANTYDSVRYLCAESPDDSSRRLEYGLSVAPLARTILDSVFTLVFIFEDFPDRMEWYLKSGWRELHDEGERLQRTYGADSSWQSWLEDHQKWVKEFQRLAGVTSEEAAQASQVRRWLNPGRMPNQSSTAQVRDYLSHLNDWFYRYMSADSHLSIPGLMKRAGPLVAYEPEERADRDRALEARRSTSVVETVIVFLALLSEVNAALGFDLGQRCRYIWTMLNTSFPSALELYDLRYRTLL